MINNLYLSGDEKRTVVGDCYNYVAKSLFPCSIRVLNRFGQEHDRFDNITSGFSFKLPVDDLYKIEITNGAFAQDVKIYSGVCEVKNINCFSETYHSFLMIPSVLFSFSLLQIVNNSKQSLSCTIAANDISNSKNTVHLSDTTLIGVPTATYYLTDANNDTISDIALSESSSATSLTNPIKACLYTGYNNYPLMPGTIPAESSLIYMCYSASQQMDLNIKVER